MMRLIPRPIAPPPIGEVNDHARLNYLIRRELSNDRRGTLAHEFREMLTPYLITDLQSDQFRHIHRATSPHPARSTLHHPLSVPDFMEFLSLEGPLLRDHYLNFKSRGHTGCVIVADEVTSRLNRRVRDCATLGITADGMHHYSIAAIEGRDYVIDFTIDQFLAYPEIVERHALYSTLRRVDPPPSYAGALVMPLC